MKKYSFFYGRHTNYSVYLKSDSIRRDNLLGTVNKRLDIMDTIQFDNTLQETIEEPKIEIKRVE